MLFGICMDRFLSIIGANRLGGETTSGAKRLVEAKRPGGKRLGGERTRGGNGLGAKRPGFPKCGFADFHFF